MYTPEQAYLDHVVENDGEDALEYAVPFDELSDMAIQGYEVAADMVNGAQGQILETVMPSSVPTMQIAGRLGRIAQGIYRPLDRRIPADAPRHHILGRVPSYLIDPAPESFEKSPTNQQGEQ